MELAIATSLIVSPFCNLTRLSRLPSVSSGGSSGSGVLSKMDISCVLCTNGCPCGFYSDEERECKCTPLQINRYLGRISGPFLDRLDIHVEVPRPSFSELESLPNGESSQTIQKRVESARRLQVERLREYKINTETINCNAHLPTSILRDVCVITQEGKTLLKEAFDRLKLTARSHNKILKVARTIADLSQKECIDAAHIAEAIQYRNLERNLWQ